VREKVVQHLREVADRLRIQGNYGPGWSDVADATACTQGAEEIGRLRSALEHIAAWPKNQLDGIDAARVAKTALNPLKPGNE
jgi:hypothetical protein